MSDDRDDLDDLKAAFTAATPAPDAAKKAANLALAEKNFAALQETRQAARPTSDRPTHGLFRGVRTMIAKLSPRAALTTTTAVLAVGLVISLPQLTERNLPGFSGQPELTEAPLGGSGTLSLEDSGTDRSLSGGRVVDAAPGEADLVEEFAAQEAPEPPAPAPMAEAETRGLSQSKPATAARKQTGNGAGGLLSLQSVPADDIVTLPEPNTEAYPEAESNPLKLTAEEPVSTFSIDVDTASYAILRSTITSGRLPNPEQVRIEEMINYFPYDYAAPEAGEHPFKPTVSVVPTPWNNGTKLVHIAIQGQKPAMEDRPPLNLVFLIDTSGSMNQPNKLPLLKQSLSLMLSQLTEQDQVAIVTYAGSAGQVLAPTSATERSTILNALQRLDAGGSTAGQAGLQQAYAVAEGMAEEGEVTRVILATDGDFNVGLSDPEALKDYIAEKRESGSYLSVLGFGRGNLDDATMQALAQNGNGQAAYIDTLSEAQKVLVDQAAGAMFPIADDVKIQVEFNPAQISEYRLIGYETRALKREDFNNDKVDAGDIGAGHSVTAIYEVTPAGSDAELVDPLRYGEVAASGETSDELGFLKLRYKAPGEEASTLIEAPILPATAEAEGEAGFAIAIASFGELLKRSDFTGDWSYDDAIALANATKGDDAYGYRAEAIRLMRLASSLSEQ
ncbi:VWA domain-containing protein [Roseovarius faecimaris]|uniref:VWA domain-containing protein n=1 Tax=Roseovarius faecimaris TaxID=2494550 RepID=A0A6I6IT59_9RHOB|nr:VWA domain-containing protein [Roseovarius faecimaris]QGX99915.1 VWA domain-containing protein [Roseovarius faecimaris]